MDSDLISTISAVAQAETARAALWATVIGVVVNAAVVVAALWIPRLERSWSQRDLEQAYGGAAETCEIALGHLDGLYITMQKACEARRVDGGKMHEALRRMDAHLMALEHQLGRIDVAVVADIIARTIIIVREIRGDMELVTQVAPSGMHIFQTESLMHIRLMAPLNRLDAMIERADLAAQASHFRKFFTNHKRVPGQSERFMIVYRALRRIRETRLPT